ncbi:hypothetical protein ACQ96U_27110, partial [Zooshikella sp. RANM57]
WGAAATATAIGMDIASQSNSTTANSLSQSEQYRRRAQEWTIQRDSAQDEVLQIQAQQEALVTQMEAAELQKNYLETQRAQTQAQRTFLQTKFTNEALYSWMQGRLSTVYYQFYDLTVSRCQRAEAGYQWETEDTRFFIKPGAWDDNHAGLLSGEALQLNLTHMESAYLDWKSSVLEISRTVSMAKEGQFEDFKESVNEALN